MRRLGGDELLEGSKLLPGTEADISRLAMTLEPVFSASSVRRLPQSWANLFIVIETSTLRLRVTCVHDIVISAVLTLLRLLLPYYYYCLLLITATTSLLPLKVFLLPHPQLIGGRGIDLDRFLSLFVSLFLCFFVSKITRKRLDRFSWNFQGRYGVTMGRPHYMFGQFRETARCRDAKHEGLNSRTCPQEVNATSAIYWQQLLFYSTSSNQVWRESFLFLWTVCMERSPFRRSRRSLHRNF